MKPNPAAPVDLAEWDVIPDAYAEVPRDVLATLVKCARALREVQPWLTYRAAHKLAADALANVIDTAGPGGSG